MIVYFCIIIVSLLGFCGLVTDTGRMELRQDQLQAAADAGALAAAGEVWHANSASNWQTAADKDIATYETANNVPSTAPSAVRFGAAYGPYVGDNSTVQVIVTQNFPTIFLGLLGHASSSITLTAKAVAQIPPCMIFFGNPMLGGVYDYGVASAGVDPTPYACPLYSTYGVSIDYFSRFSNNQVRSSAPASYSTVSGSLVAPAFFNVPAISNPLSYIATPSPSLCQASVSMLAQPSSAVISLLPGTYCGKTNSLASFVPGPGVACGQVGSKITPAVDIEGMWSSCPTQGGTNGNNCMTRPTINLSAGLYVFIGGANFTCATVNGTGVTMYFTNSPTVGYGLMHITSTAWNVSAPNIAFNNSIAGIAMMNDPAWTGGSQDFQLVYSTWYGDGVVYLRGTGLDGYSLNMSAPDYMNIVAPNMYTYDAEVRPSVNYANLPAGNPLQTVVSLVQ